MRLNPTILFVGLFLILSVDLVAAGRPAQSRDSSYPIAVISSNSLIYTGPEYAKTYTTANGHPFFREQAMTGWVDYYQNRYQGIPISYDIESDLVIFHEPVNQIKISLVNEKVDGFMLDGHQFISVKDVTGFVGYFEAAYMGKKQVLIKWFKILTRSGVEEGKYITYSNIFIRDGNTLTQVASKNELFSYFGKNKKQVQQYYQQQHLNYKKDPAHTVSALVAYGEQNGY